MTISDEINGINIALAGLIFLIGFITWRYSDLYYRRGVRDKFYNEIESRYIKLLAIFPQLENATKEMEAAQADYSKIRGIYKLFNNDLSRVVYMAAIRQKIFDIVISYTELSIWINHLKSENLLAEKKVITDLIKDLERTKINVVWRDGVGPVSTFVFSDEINEFSESTVMGHVLELRKEIAHGDFDSYLFSNKSWVFKLFDKVCRIASFYGH
jgi:hypothetical protein